MSITAQTRLVDGLDIRYPGCAALSWSVDKFCIIVHECTIEGVTALERMGKSGSLTVVGTGIRLVSQTSVEARVAIERAEKVFFLLADPVTHYWITQLNQTSESLHNLYHPDKPRLTSYLEMVEHILSYVRRGLDVCFATYGHPGVFAYPSHEVIRRARLEGFAAVLLPGISAEDCLFADLGVDPGARGCQSYEATDFLIYKRKFDAFSSLILWQIGVIGVLGYKDSSVVWNLNGLHVLVETLAECYNLDHEVVVYEAAQYPICDPLIERISLAKVPQARVTPMSTLYVPPRAPASADIEMIKRLGIPLEGLRGQNI